MKKYIVTLLLLSLNSVQAAELSQADIQNVLSEHNHLRNLHGAPALTWNNQLAQFASQYASRCIFQHSHDKYGENLAAGYPTLTAAIRTWYDEAKSYFYRFPGFSMKTGHFTQLVWKSTTQLGCGYAACNGKNSTPGIFLVCEYNQPGNVLSQQQFVENVLPEQRNDSQVIE
jgi:uncharacterized protein YkwD